VSFRLRKRLEGPPASPGDVADLPPIEGLPAYSVRPPEKPSPAKWSDAEYDLWTAHLEDVVASDTREVWIDHAHFEGSARIEGRFFLKPMRAAEVGPVRIAVAKGIVQSGQGPIAEALDGSTVDLTVARFDPRTAGGTEILHRLSLDSDAHAVVPDLDLLRVLPDGVRAKGTVKLGPAILHVRSGELLRDSHLEVTMAALAVAWGEYRATGTFALTADVARAAGAERNRLTLRALATDLLWFPAKGATRRSTPFLRARRVDVTGDAGALGLVHPFDDLHVVVDLARCDLPDARALSRYVPTNTDIAIEGGHAWATANLEAWLAEKRATGSAALHAEDLDLRVAKIRVRGHASVISRFSSYDFATHRVEDATLDLTESDGSLASNAAPKLPLVHVDRLRLSAHGRHVDLADPLRSLDVTIAMPTADVVAPDLLHAYLPKGHDMRLVSGNTRFSLDARLKVADRLARGTVDIQSKGMTVAYREFRLDADVLVHGRVHDWHWGSGDLALPEASVDVAHVTITHRGSEGERGGAAVSFARIALVASSAHFKFADPLANISMSASVAGARVHRPSALGAFLPERTALLLESEDGGFDAEVRADVEEHVAKGQVRVHAFRMGGGGQRVHLGGDIDLFADVAGWDLDRGTMALRESRLKVTRVEGRFHPRGGPDFSAARVELEARTPGFDIQRPTLRGGDFHLVIENAVLPDARALSALLPPEGDVWIESGTGRVSADLAVSASNPSAAGTADVTLANGALRLGGMLLSGDFHINAGLRGLSPEEDLVGLSDARVEMRNVAISGATATTSGWRGDVTLSRASLRLAPTPQLDGVVSLDARDARPFLAILFGNDFPKILVRVVDVPRLVASARVTVGADRLAVLDLDAGGGDVALRGSYAAIGGRRRGGVIARKCFLSVGLGLDDDGTHLRLFGLEGWLRGRRRAVVKLLDGQGPL
jgi:hypothetical protein